jgi:hypothetical protein
MDPNENKFNYDLDAVRVRVTDEEMINSLREFHAEIRRPFTTGLFDKWEKKICGSQAISRRFGSWREALSKIGINRGIQAHTYTVEELLDNLDMIWRELKYPPGKRQLVGRGYGISERPYINRWGSVRNACEMLKSFREGKINEDELLNNKNAERKRGSLSYKIRYEILTRDQYRCVKCGKSPRDGIFLEIDHGVPFSKGGSDDYNNLQTLCNICNSGKSNRHIDVIVA